MKVQIIIDTQSDDGTKLARSKVWEGELEILQENEYLAKISIVGEGQPQPLCEVPFAFGVGHYMWIPPDNGVGSLMGDDPDDV